MKNILMVTGLFFILTSFSYGQWYVRKYQVSNINYLNKQQLDEALANSKRNLSASSIVAVMGGAGILIIKYGYQEPNEDPTLLEQIIGEKGMNGIGTVFCAGILAGGTIGAIAYLGRIGKIKSVINKNFPASGSLNISPMVFSDNLTRSIHPGIMLNYSF